MNKKLLLLCLVLVMALGMFSLPVAADTVASGSCGAGLDDSVFWELDDSGTMTISGTGNMGSSQWSSYNAQITTVIIESGVTSVGNNNFQSCSNLTSVSLPSTLESIGNNAFYNCQKLEKIIIPGSVKTIGQQAFRNCTGAKVLEINSGLETIGNNAFYGCSSIATPLVIPATITSMGQGAFRNCTAIPSLTVSEGITTIGNQCFYYLRGMKELSLPSTLTTIGNNAFNNCDSLEELILPSSLTSIDSYAFTNCTKLKKVEMPDSVTTLGIQVFTGCSALTDIKLSAELTAIPNQAFQNCTGLTSAPIPEKVESIGDNAFYGCTGLTSLSFPDSVKSLGASSFANCTNLTTVTLGKGITTLAGNTFNGCTAISDFSIDPGNEKLFVKDGFIFNRDDETVFLAPVPGAGLSGEVTIPDGVTSIPADAFNGNTAITKVIIPDSVTSIGNNAFRSCSALEEVVVSKNAESIPNYCFYMCSKLTSVELKGGIKSIGQYAFYSCGALASLELPATVESIGNLAFGSCGSLTKLDLPSALTTVGSNAFSGCAVEELVFGENATNLASGFCQNAGLLKKVELHADLTTLQSNAFQNCPMLTEVTIPESVTSIGQNAFRQCSSLTSIDIPDNVSSIGSWCFYDCTSLSDVKIGKSVPADQAFGSYTGVWTNAPIATITVSAENTTMESIDNIVYDKDHTKILFAAPRVAGKVVIAEGVTSLEGSTFKDNDTMTELILPESLTTINSSALNNCSGLTSLTLPESVTDFSGYAFRNCGNLKEIIVENDDYMNKNGLIYSADGKVLKLCPPGYEGNVAISASVEEIADAAFFYCTKVSGVTLPKKLKTIGEDGFCGASAITKMTVPNSVKNLGPYAFQYCSSLTELKLPAGLSAIPNSMCDGCTSLPVIDIPATVTSIGQRAFRNCSEIRELDLPANLETIGNYAFSGCTNLQQVEIPEGVTTLPNYCFQNCSYMPSIILPDTITALNALSLPTQASGCVFNTVYYRGSDTQWAAITKNADLTNVEIVYLYGNEGEAPVIAAQPQDVAVAKGEAATLSVTVEAPAAEDDSININWYSNTSKSSSGGTLIPGSVLSEDGLTSTITVPTDVIGNKFYYAVITKTTDSGEQGMVTSDVATVTVLMDDFEGRGTEDNPYLINNIDDLQTLAGIVAEGRSLTGINFKLTDDIALPEDWAGIGTGNQSLAFTGILDGDNHTVTSAYGGMPLFAYTASCTIKNINIAGEYIAEEALIANYTVASNFNYATNIDNVNIKSGTVVKGKGYISGYASGVNRINISNCTVEAGVKIGWDAEADAPVEQNAVGSFGGEYNGEISNCVSYADVYGNSSVGGILGIQGQSMSANRVTNCAFYGTVNATGERAGGIVGSGYDNTTAPNTTPVSIQNCVVGGSVTGADRVGGIYGSEGGLEQAWNPAIIRNNVFYGTVNATAEDADSVGGIIGRMCSLNKNNFIENNYYLEGCGADKGIGKVIHVDTSTHEFGIDEETGVIYYDTSRDDLNAIHLLVDPPGDQYTSVARTDYNRTDDPLGADADKLTKAVSEAAMTDGTVVDALNANANSLHNWIGDENGYPALSSDPIPFALEVSGEFKTEYVVGEELDLSGAAFAVTYSDGSKVDLSLDDVTISGFDSSERALLTLIVSYQGLTAEIPVKVINPVVSNEITVYFTLLGDEIHDADEDENYHLLETDTLTTWIERTEVKVDANATVLDLFDKVLTDNGYSYSNPAGDYIKAITTPDGVTLAEFTNGANSGWMYTYNRKHVQKSVIQQFLNDGDEIVWHYTDDYKQEEIAENVAKQVEKLIDDIGEVTLDSEEAIVAAREAYEALSDKEKAIVANLDVLEAAEEAYAALKGESDKIKNVEDLIAAIGEVTADSGEAIAAAREAYDALSNSEKDQVANAEDLRRAESAFAKLSPFEDVSPDDYFFEAVKWAVANDITKGTDDTHFSPNANCSRGQVVTFLWRAAGMPEAEGENPFSDVTEKDYFYDAVLWAVENEITTGSGEGKFSPNGNCTRGQVATFLWRAAGSPEAEGENPFTDVTESDYFYDAVLWAVDQEITKGTSATAFSPNAICTRGQVVTFLFRAQ